MFMESNTIMNLRIEDFKNSPELADYIEYVDNHFLLINNMEGIRSNNKAIRLDCFLIAICIEGDIQININDQSYHLHTHDSLLCLPNSILRRISCDSHYKVNILGFSNSFIRNTLKIEKRILETGMHIYKNPILSAELMNANDYEYFKHYAALIESNIKDDSHCYHNETKKYIYSALLFDIFGYINKDIPETEKTKYSQENIKRADYTCIKFMELLSEDNGKHRSVSYFADKLCYSPKYFSNIIKKTCGKNPLVIINEYAIKHIKDKLKYSEKSIKEISEEFNFPNQSFFGRYVKAHIGMSPAKYKNTKEE